MIARRPLSGFRLRKLEWFAVVVALVAAMLGGAFAARPRPDLQYMVVGLWLVLVLVTFIGIVQAVVRWGRDRRRTLLIFAIVSGGLALAYPAGLIGRWHRNRQFMRALPAYERVVEGFRSGIIPLGLLSPDSLPLELRACCYQVTGERDETGELIVQFWVGWAFPPRHTGWMYYAGTSVREVAVPRGWYRGKLVAPYWYHVSD